jgi:hypothetical protein
MKRKPKYMLCTHNKSGDQWLVSYKTEGRLIDKLGLYYFQCSLNPISPDAIKGVKALLAGGKHISIKKEGVL